MSHLLSIDRTISSCGREKASYGPSIVKSEAIGSVRTYCLLRSMVRTDRAWAWIGMTVYYQLTLYTWRHNRTSILLIRLCRLYDITRSYNWTCGIWKTLQIASSLQHHADWTIGWMVYADSQIEYSNMYCLLKLLNMKETIHVSLYLLPVNSLLVDLIIGHPILLDYFRGISIYH